MGLSISLPVRNRSKRAETIRKSAEDVREFDFSRPSSTIGPHAYINFQDRAWPKQTKGLGESEIHLQDNKYNATPVYESLPTYASSNPTYMNTSNRNILDGTCYAATYENNEVLGTTDYFSKQTQVCPSTSSENHYTDDCLTSSRQTRRRRSSLAPLSESAQGEKHPGRESRQETIHYSTVAGKGRRTEYTTTTCFERPDPMLNVHEYTVVDQPIDTCNPAIESEITRKDWSAYDRVKKEFKDESLALDVTLQSRHVGDHKVKDEMSHDVFGTDPGCDATNRNLAISETMPPVDSDYEPWPPNEYRHQREVSYKGGEMVVNKTPRNFGQSKTPAGIWNSSARQPFKPQAKITSEPPILQPLPLQLEQPQEIPLLHPSQPLPVEPNHRLVDHQTNDSQVRYRLGLGSDLRAPGMTISVPTQTDSGSSHVELQWSSNPDAFPVLSVDQRPLTKVLHCLPRGSTFASPVSIALDLPVSDGKIEGFYSPTDVGQTPVWTKLRATIDACTGNTRLTDGQQPLENQVLLSKNGRRAVLVLRHFCSFVLVENGNVVSPKKAEVAIFLKTKIQKRISGQESWLAIFKVVLGCDNNNMLRRFKSLKEDGYRLIEKTGLLLYKSGSGVEVGIRDVEWMVGSTQKQSRTRVVHDFDYLWSGLEATSQFWMESKGSKQTDEQLALTVIIRQEGRLETPVGIYCDMNTACCVGGVILHDLRNLSKSRRNVTATRSSPTLLLAPANILNDADSDTANRNSDLDFRSLETEDPSSCHHGAVGSDSCQDFELNYCSTGKAVIQADVSDDKTASKRFTYDAERTENAGVYQHDPISPMSISKGRFKYSVNDLHATIVGDTVMD